MQGRLGRGGRARTCARDAGRAGSRRPWAPCARARRGVQRRPPPRARSAPRPRTSSSCPCHERERSTARPRPGRRPRRPPLRAQDLPDDHRAGALAPRAELQRARADVDQRARRGQQCAAGPGDQVQVVGRAHHEIRAAHLWSPARVARQGSCRTRRGSPGRGARRRSAAGRARRCRGHRRDDERTQHGDRSATEPHAAPSLALGRPEDEHGGRYRVAEPGPFRAGRDRRDVRLLRPPSDPPGIPGSVVADAVSGVLIPLPAGLRAGR
jgi:hypothetical protein